MTDPDRGNETYTYDSDGNLTNRSTRGAVPARSMSVTTASTARSGGTLLTPRPAPTTPTATTAHPVATSGLDSSPVRASLVLGWMAATP